MSNFGKRNVAEIQLLLALIKGEFKKRPTRKRGQPPAIDWLSVTREFNSSSECTQAATRSELLNLWKLLKTSFSAKRDEEGHDVCQDPLLGEVYNILEDFPKYLSNLKRPKRLKISPPPSPSNFLPFVLTRSKRKLYSTIFPIVDNIVGIDKESDYPAPNKVGLETTEGGELNVFPPTPEFHGFEQPPESSSLLVTDSQFETAVNSAHSAPTDSPRKAASRLKEMPPVTETKLGSNGGPTTSTFGKELQMRLQTKKFLCLTPTRDPSEGASGFAGTEAGTTSTNTQVAKKKVVILGKQWSQSKNLVSPRILVARKNIEKVNPKQDNPQQVRLQQVRSQQVHPQQVHLQKDHPRQVYLKQFSPQKDHPQQVYLQQVNPQQVCLQQVHPQKMNPQQDHPPMQVLQSPIQGSVVPGPSVLSLQSQVEKQRLLQVQVESTVLKILSDKKFEVECKSLELAQNLHQENVRLTREIADHKRILHELKIENEQKLVEKNMEVCDAKIRSIKHSEKLSEELIGIEKEITLFKREEAETNNKVAQLRLKALEVKLKQLEAAKAFDDI